MEGGGVVVEGLDGVEGVSEAGDVEALASDEAFDGLEEHFFVVDVEDLVGGGSLGGGDLGGWLGGGEREGRRGKGEEDGEGGAEARGGIDGDGAMVVGDDLVDEGEAESGAAGGGFGGVEGFKDAGEVVGGDTDAVVGDAEAGVGAGGEF